MAKIEEAKEKETCRSKSECEEGKICDGAEVLVGIGGNRRRLLGVTVRSGVMSRVDEAREEHPSCLRNDLEPGRGARLGVPLRRQPPNGCRPPRRRAGRLRIELAPKGSPVDISEGTEVTELN